MPAVRASSSSRPRCSSIPTESRVSHHLVAFESAVAGTKERVSFDAAGHVRRILRHYEPATWPFIAGVAATLLPVASGILGDGVIPTSLADLRQILVARGVPSRDVPMQGGALDLTEEAGLLAANEHFIRKAIGVRRDGRAVGDAALRRQRTFHPPDRSHHRGGRDSRRRPCRRERDGVRSGGDWSRAHESRQVRSSPMPPWVRTARCPSGRTVRNRVWFDAVGESARPDHQPTSYGDRLARLMAEARSHEEGAYADRHRIVRGVHVPLKRVLRRRGGRVWRSSRSSPLLLVVAAGRLARIERVGSSTATSAKGLGGRVFRCWKFRTMYVGAHAAQKESEGARQDGRPALQARSRPEGHARRPAVCGR